MIFVSDKEMEIITAILEKHVCSGEVRAFGSRCKGTNRDLRFLVMRNFLKMCSIV